MITILGNLSQSLAPVQDLIRGMSYLLGIVFIFVAISKMRKIAESHHGGSKGKGFSALAYFMLGAILLFIPSAIRVMADTAFGPDNVLSYSQRPNPFDVQQSIRLLIQTAGWIWFVRGAVLLAHASEPGVKEGSKGLVFLIIGIFAVRFDNTLAVINATINYITTITMGSPKS